MKKYLLYILPLLAVLSCEKAENGQGNNQEPEKPTPASYTVAGKVEKGPFVQGSSITMATMDAKLNATGKNYTATITDDAGTFSFGTQEFDSQYARLTASGYFFNEVKGELSKGTLTLSAIVDLSNKKSVNVNLLTHLESMRIQKLISTDGKSFADAVKQAQKELLTCFEFQQFASTDASQFSITSGTDEASALILISSIIQMDRSEAQITEWLSRLASDFAEDGQFSDANKEQVFKDRELLYAGLSEISQNVVKRYSELGIYVTVKDISAIVDWDGDGIVGNETLKEGETVTLSPATIEVPAEGGHFTVEIKSPVKVYLEQPKHGTGYLEEDPSLPYISDNVFTSFYDGIHFSPMSYTKELKDKILTVDVSATQNSSPTSSEIDFYIFSGEKVATLKITQAAVEVSEKLKLGDGGKAAMSGFMYRFAQAMTMNNDADKLYTHLRSNPAFIAPMNPNYSSLETIWSYFYQSVRMLLQMKDYDASAWSVFQEYFNIYSGIAFYNMIVFWGDVPYFTTTPSADNPYLPRTKTADIFPSLENQMKAAIEYAEEKKNIALAEDANDALFLSKDVARILLADVYMYQGKYSDAEPLLQKVFDNGFYSISSSFEPAPNSQDVILAIRRQSDGTKAAFEGNNTTPIFTYTDVLLSLAECKQKTGDAEKAKKLCNIVERALNLPETSGTINDIKECRKLLMLPGYFAFLKRTGLAKSEIGLADYQLLLPIPQREISNNPKMTQNPGY